jgi:hypothetical protein
MICVSKYSLDKLFISAPNSVSNEISLDAQKDEGDVSRKDMHKVERKAINAPYEQSVKIYFKDVKISKEKKNYRKFHKQTRVGGKLINLFTEMKRTKRTGSLICFYFINEKARKNVYICRHFPDCDNIARGTAGCCDTHKT